MKPTKVQLKLIHCTVDKRPVRNLKIFHSGIKGEIWSDKLNKFVPETWNHEGEWISGDRMNLMNLNLSHLTNH